MPKGIYVRTEYHREINRLGHTGLRKHGATCGDKKTPAYRSWDKIKQRCLNPNNPRYKEWGGRNIKICKQWLGKDGFTNFLKDMGERPTDKTIDRINNDGNYEPSNCRWATRFEQQGNTRRNNKTVGVCWSKAENKWRAYYSRKQLGFFSNYQEAVKARKLEEIIPK